MRDLLMLKKRIKNAKIYTGARRERLYFSFRRSTSCKRISTWFEVINNSITPCARVYLFDERNREEEEYIVNEIYRAFHEILYDCELQRSNIPLQERLSDDIVPFFDDRSEPHQIEALRFLCSMKVSALNGDVGTMKTKIAIDLCISRFMAGEIKKVLVFLPVATKANFMEQVNLWCMCKELEWKLIGMETMGSSQRAVFEALSFVDNETQIIIDESHLIKNPLAKRSKRIKLVCNKASYKMVMTGTPVTENVHNIYMQYAVLSDAIIGVSNWLKFEEKYLIIGGRSGTEVIGYKNLDHLLSLIEPYTHQISKDVLNLSPYRVNKHQCCMNDLQDALYEQEKSLLLDKIMQDDVHATDIFRTFIRMQQICSGFYVKKNKEIMHIGTDKTELLEELDLSKKTVFFCNFIFEVDLLIKILGKENCCEFTGRNPKTRYLEKDEFVNGEKKFFIATMKSGGTGLNGLQFVANSVVFFSNSFSYMTRQQSIGRVYRKGQTRTVNIHDFTSSSGIEDRIMRCLSRKEGLADEIKRLMEDRISLRKYVESL